MRVSHPVPPVWRVCLAFIVAPIFAALAEVIVVTGLDFTPDYWHQFFVMVIPLVVFGLPQAFVFGIPTYLLLKGRFAPTPLACAITGSLVAALPWLILNLLTPKSGYYYASGHVLYQDGSYTVWGWLDLLQSIGTLALTGAVAGLVFWFVAAWRMKVPTIEAAPEV